MDSKLECVQRHGNAAMEEVNCTEIVRLTPLAGRPSAAFVQSTSTLSLLRVQEVALMSPGEDSSHWECLRPISMGVEANGD